MRWERGHESPDVIDRRGEGGGTRAAGGNLVLALAPLLLRSRGGRVVLLLLVAGAIVAGVLGKRGEHAPQATRTTGAQSRGGDDVQVQFVSFVLDDAQQTWQRIFSDHGRGYRHAKLVLFTDATPTACGFGEAATGPFYCPSDERVYIDLGFFHELADRFGAKGDFAEAYVIAHEIGHHVQQLLGITTSVGRLRASERKGPASASVRLELQADCFAGVWAHSTEARGLLEPGDVDEALRAAAAVGDDRLQREATGRVTPDSFTHGTAAQRARWFNRGLERGTIAACDTFGAPTL